MGTRLTFLHFAVGRAFATIPLTPNYEGTVLCRALVSTIPMISKWHLAIEPREFGGGFSIS